MISRKKERTLLLKPFKAFNPTPSKPTLVQAKTGTHLRTTSLDRNTNTSLKKKEEIKIELQNKELSVALEPMLSSHRKGLLKKELEKKINYDSTSSTIILKDLDQAFKDENTAKASELIDIIYSNVESKLFSLEIIQDLNIPKSIE